ncbi:thioredoxin family protein [Pedobacter sp. L105]|uniref:DUF1223 domain-containing protein n=1 Tax=Pedobacter sp. L105 TaxID=1641871 RepID=UPI00131BAD03|nr:DUF1223 domain-containing protein [Pedobacter sp. L105]
MKILTSFFIAGSIALIALSVKSKPRPAVPVQSDHSPGFAVIELFTSEGCSSCPPADELLAKIQQENKNKPVYILAFHVDYWNRLGWTDIFSNPLYSKRQNDYAEQLNLHSIYTPQAIVNGQMEFVGSEERTLRTAITKQLQTSSSEQLRLKGITVHSKQVSLRYLTKDVQEKESLVVALVQKSAVSHVKRGENSGRTLSHVQIVRALETIALQSTNGNVVLNLPEGIELKNLEIIAFLQQRNSGKITAATKMELLSANPAQ